MIFFRKFVLATALSTVGISFAYAASECTAVYANATRNITLQQKQKTALNYFFNKHCQKNGEVNKSSFGADIGATIEGIPFTFSVNSASSEQKMEEFCKTGLQQNFSQEGSTDFRDEVVVASLNSFNQCLALESRGIRITHQEQSPRSVLIYGEKTNSFTVASLDAISYDPKAISCRSTGFSSDGKSIKLDGTKSHSISKNFTIECVRTPKSQGTNQFYQKTVLGISTSLGPYSIELMEDQLFGFASASQAYANYNKAINERDAAIIQKKAAENQSNALQQRINNTSVAVATLSVGEYSPESTRYYQPREYCGTNPEVYAKNVCGARKAQVHAMGGYGGNKCGYQHYVITCLSQ